MEDKLSKNLAVKLSAVAAETTVDTQAVAQGAPPSNVTQLHANRAQQPWDPYEVWLNRISRPRQQSKAVAGQAPVMLPVARERDAGSPARPELM